jgi:hypothetical protein
MLFIAHMSKDTLKNKKSVRTWHSSDANETQNISAGQKVFLLRYMEEPAPIIKNKGPFRSQEDANEELRKCLKNGICSWLVSYDG